jgi:hypothetical protein
MSIDHAADVTAHVTASIPTDEGRAGGLRIVRRLPVRPTPAGAFRAVARPEPDPVARMLQGILHEPTTPTLDEGSLCRWVGTTDLDAALAVLLSAQDDGLIEGIVEPQRVPEGALDVLVPLMLESLTDTGEVLVSDADGLPLWSHGFSTELAVRLSAMSGDLASLNARHADVLTDVVGDDVGAWALVDGIGASRLGCWPLHIGEHRFVLVARGLPRMHHPNFTQLVWVLIRRYG